MISRTATRRYLIDPSLRSSSLFRMRNFGRPFAPTDPDSHLSQALE